MVKSIKIIGLIVLMMVILMGGCRVLVKGIFNRKDCESFNIDNIEVRTGIDIPKTAGCDCVSDGKTKTAEFVIDKSKVELNDYIAKQGFIKKDSIYELSDESDHTKWTAKLNKKTAELKFILHYLK